MRKQSLKTIQDPLLNAGGFWAFRVFSALILFIYQFIIFHFLRLKKSMFPPLTNNIVIFKYSPPNF